LLGQFYPDPDRALPFHPLYSDGRCRKTMCHTKCRSCVYLEGYL
jgi:hypothetical protein